ncbi:MAG: 1-acyl-sn-glycerol-3-phosphate acyltransferase [Desulfovibrio sp.]|jgi:1-acyl-sn-glycerol-3-phosphate acyltransferase|nr:1-acyl-sn-glycerol-3-phosphate acyltransferase [Desulfovibrio sp.]
MTGRFVHGLRLIWLNVGFYSGLILMTTVSIVFISFPALCWFRFVRGLNKGAAMRQLVWYYGRAWTKLLAFFVPVKLENCAMPLPKPCIITPNHQSFFDTYCFAFMPERDVVFAVRAWPFLIPFYGPYMRLAGYLNTESGNAEELLCQSKEILNNGACIGVFPEGTRSPNGKMSRFHSGAFHLAALTGVPIVPVCMEGTGVFLHRNGFLLRPARIAVKVLDPVYPRDFADSGDEVPLLLRKTVKARLQKALDELRSECPDRTLNINTKESSCNAMP